MKPEENINPGKNETLTQASAGVKPPVPVSGIPLDSDNASESQASEKETMTQKSAKPPISVSDIPLDSNNASESQASEKETMTQKSVKPPIPVPSIQTGLEMDDTPENLGGSFMGLLPSQNGFDTQKSSQIAPNEKVEENAVTLSRRESVGKYQIIEEIGRGGMGCVYKALDIQLNRTVAVKMVLPGIASPESIARFTREATTMAKLQHPNIVAIYDINCEQSQPYFAMEFVEGKSLKSIIQKESLTTRRIVEIMIKMASAVEYAHKHGVIHRDLKPANVMITPDNEPKVMDFGLAKLSQKNRKLSQSGMVVGTLQYMSPEQASGKSRNVDERSDVYSLGAILYELLTGRPPFSGDTAFNLMYQIMEKDPIVPTMIRCQIPKELEMICLKALQKDKKDRYPSAQAFADDLKKFGSGDTVRVVIPGTWQKALKKAKKNIPLVAAFSLCILAIVLWRFSETPQNGQTLKKQPSGIQDSGKKTENSGAKNNIPNQTNQPNRPSTDSGNQGTANQNQTAVKTQKEKNLIATYGLPANLWKECKYEYQGQKMLDMSADAWCNLTVADQQKYAQIYQEGYARAHDYSVEIELKPGTVSFELRLIPPGRFWMGSLPEENRRVKDETRHRVVISRPFYMGKTEVTQAQYKSLGFENLSFFQDDKRPVEFVTPKDGENFCIKAGMRFPTEAEWEYACRSGVTRSFYWGDTFQRNNMNSISYWMKEDIWTDQEFKTLSKIIKRNTPQTTHPKTFAPNAFGLYDMLGNVYEWCQDYYGEYENTEEVDPEGPSIGKKRVIRGGCWRASAEKCRSAFRYITNHPKGDKNIGFRVVKSVYEINDKKKK